MKKYLLLALCMLSIPAMAQVGTKNFIDQPYIEVNGLAKREIIPDLIYVNIIISEKDNKGKASVENQESQMLKKLKELGINTEKDLSILDFSSNFEDYWYKRKDIFTSKAYELTLHSGNEVAKVFNSLEKLEISNISIDRVDHSQLPKFRQEVKIEAIKAAKVKAKAMMEAIDQKIGKAIFVQEIQMPIYQRPRRTMQANVMMSSPEMDQSDADIEFQKIILEYKVNARFTIE